MVAGDPAALPNGTAAGQIPLPWALAVHLPLLGRVLPSRFSEFFAAAFLLALILDQLYERTGCGGQLGSAALAPIAVAVVALLPVVPAGNFSAV